MKERSPWVRWDFLGSAVVTDHFVRLTPTEGGNEGALWSKARMPFKEWQVMPPTPKHYTLSVFH